MPSISRITLHNFRAFPLLDVTFDEDLTVLVGENNVGKSSIGLGIERALNSLVTRNSAYLPSDRTDDAGSAVSFDLEFALSDADQLGLWQRVLSQCEPSVSRDRLLKWFLTRPARNLTLSMNSSGTFETARLGPFLFSDAAFAFREFSGTLQSLRDSISSLDEETTDISVESLITKRSWQLGQDPIRRLLIDAQQNFKRFEEFRRRSDTASRVTGIESLSGQESAAVLLNLRNHADPEEESRYELVVRAIERLFPGVTVRVVESEPGSGQAEIQFRRPSRSTQRLSDMSAGTNQMLTLLTSMLGRKGLILFVEHPEQHLHPQSMRFLSRLLHEASADNQIIITTHDPHFIEPSYSSGIRRVFVDAAGYSQVAEPLVDQAKVAGQIKTALRELGDREILFAKCVILVEDESQVGFLQGIAPTLGFDLDANGISVIDVGGEGGYTPYRATVEAFRIPFVCLKDRSWNDDGRYPRDQFFSLGGEIEDALDRAGLQKQRQKVIAEVGESKQRVMRELGSRLKDEEIPAIFGDVFGAAFDCIERNSAKELAS